MAWLLGPVALPSGWRSFNLASCNRFTLQRLQTFVADKAAEATMKGGDAPPMTLSLSELLLGGKRELLTLIKARGGYSETFLKATKTPVEVILYPNAMRAKNCSLVITFKCCTCTVSAVYGGPLSSV